MITPDMTGKAADIDNPILLFQRIGYRWYLMFRPDDGPHALYEDFDRTDLRRLAELDGRKA